VVQRVQESAKERGKSRRIERIRGGEVGTVTAEMERRDAERDTADDHETL